MNCPGGTRETTLGCAPAENDLILFADYRRQTLRGFFDSLTPGIQPGVYLYKAKINIRRISENRISHLLFFVVKSMS